MLDNVAYLAQQALGMAALLAAPALAVGLLVAVLAAIAQTLTSLHDSSLGNIPRLVAMATVVALLMPWLLAQLLAYSTSIFSEAGRVMGGG